MKKVLFVCQVEFGNQADGVVKKIKGQIQAFNNMAFESYCIAYYNGIVSLGKCNSLEDVQFSGISNYSGKFNRVAFWKSVHRHIQQNLYDVIYIRYSFIDFSVLTSLKEMHRKGAKVVLEIPSISSSTLAQPCSSSVMPIASGLCLRIRLIYLLVCFKPICFTSSICKTP